MTENRRNLYGRHTGRPLRKNPARAYESVMATHGFDGRMDERDIWLEIGFGAGEHLAWQAANNPDQLHIGAEYYLNGVARGCQHVADEKLSNVRIHHGDARDVMDQLLEGGAAGRVTRAFILHPDPWPKARQWRRRIICTETLDMLAKLMPQGATLRMASDHADYQPWIMRVLMAHPAFTWTAKSAVDWTDRPDDWPQTRYEAKSIREGRPTMYIEAVRT